MIRIKYTLLSMIFLAGLQVFAQEEKDERVGGHENINSFRQLYNEMSTPNSYRTASGAPGHEYYQNEADYKMNIILDDNTQILTGSETITYHNNSPDDLEYLWVQLDQNIREEGSPSRDKNGKGLSAINQPRRFISGHLKESFNGGFKITKVSHKGKSLQYTKNWTMMRIDMGEPLKSGKSYEFSIDWNYLIQDHTKDGGRSGYEVFSDGNKGYVIAQFFPRMAVYNDVEGWQNYQFWGNGEFALPFGDYEVDITVPADHLLDGTGVLVNRKEVYNSKEWKRWERATASYDKPVIIRTQAETEEIAKGNATKTKTWKLRAKNVRDFGFATSRRFLMDAQAVKFAERDVMAMSIYPPEGNPLWEQYSTKAVVQSLKTYSKYTFDYPYPKAISVHAKGQGMEYPMICWNYGRPNEDGTYSDRTKYGMISVIIHEVGHNYFPMIVNSDERQWGWMDEGLDTFMQYLTEQDFGKTHPEAIGQNKAYPSRRGSASNIVNYMKGNQDFIAPIMSNPENVYQLGSNAYAKPATALNILRETIMGHEVFDHAFKTYAQRWMFKHPSPEDFFRTMEDASAIDLDWYWRGWFYSTENVDIGVKEVKSYYVTDKVTKEGRELLSKSGVSDPSTLNVLYVVEEGSEDFDPSLKGKSMLDIPTLKEYMMDNFTPKERANIKAPKHLYEIVFERPGGIPMPIIAEYEYADGTSERITYPVQLWRKSGNEVSKVLGTDKEIVKITIDPDLETADVDTTNNSWPKAEKTGKFDMLKKNMKK